MKMKGRYERYRASLVIYLRVSKTWVSYTDALTPDLRKGYLVTLQSDPQVKHPLN
jgi:hypothetical protein